MREIDGKTQLICLLGSPVAHSKSPVMHNEGFQALGLNYSYMAFDVKEDGLETAVKGLKTLGFRGMNLTMPNKNKIVGLCDELSPAAELCQAVNTVVNDNGRLTGYTTDGAGFMTSCRAEGYELIGKKMTLLGSGGAGTAIMVQAALDGVKEISVFSRKSSPFMERTMEVIRKLNEQTECKVVHFDYTEEDLRREIGTSYILVNSTSVGMAPETDRCLVPDASYLHSGLVVADVIYNPSETRLMKMAKEAGCSVLGGLPMLLYQGAEAFRLWTGQEMPVKLVHEKYFK